MSPYVFSGLNPSTAFMFLNQRNEEQTIPAGLEQAIVEKVSTFFNIEISDMTSKSRKREVVEPRMICIYLISKHTTLTLKQIGKLFNRDYSTIIYNRQAVIDLIFTSKDFKKLVKDVEATLELTKAA